MIIKCEIDTDDLGYRDDEGYTNSMESLLSDSLRRSIIEKSKDALASEQFKKFGKLTSDTIVADIKLRMENFLSEEISITEKWGKKTFVGSIEDLIKLRFDDILLRRVDSNGKTIEGCTSDGLTWIEWKIKEDLDGKLKKHIDSVKSSIQKTIQETINAKLIEIKDESLKTQIDQVFMNILNRQ